MKIRSLSTPLLALAALLALPLAAQATVYQFNATINAAQEVGASSSTASGLASLSYDDMGTLAVGDDSYSFTMGVSGLSGAPTGFHIHGPAAIGVNGPVRVDLAAAPFFSASGGGFLTVFGSGVVPASFGAMSMKDALMGNLAYVNVHTAADPGGAVRGQLLLVAVVPEPSSYALLLGGLGLVGFVARRRRSL
ncbi:CHRD domain-containing protein [Roseateles oligotrophus]|uniref:CHRD domain-containing protein n=1 Tax=Roseateles oligotrophus TaxID=1769250 RepID=A0ABT2YJQ4_9BURK|nr:CHRD domain-containing protein [Roseateles oligotrophus]MCV2370293.1 CHRD domain-containing protein [Roseateles oligotrophus]